MSSIIGSSDFVENPLGHDPLSTGARNNSSSSPEPASTDAPIAAPTPATVPLSASVTAADERDAARKRSVYTALCEAIKSCAAPTTRSNKWDFLAICDTLFRINIPPRELVVTLEQCCAREDLAAFGIGEREIEELGKLSWPESNGHLYAAINGDKCTITLTRGNTRRSALAFALERNPPNVVPAAATLFVAESRESVEVIKKLGLQAVISKGLEALTGKDVQKVFGGDQRNDVGWRYDFILLDFHVARLDNRPTAAIGEVITLLAAAVDVLGVDPTRRFGVCRPSAHEFRMLEHAVRFADAGPICKLLESWAAASKNVVINDWRTHFDTRPMSYARASAKLTGALQLPDVARRFAVSDALPAYLAAGREVVVDKFKKAAGATTDPFDQMDLIAAAGCAEAFFDCDPLVLAGEDVLAGRNPPNPHELRTARFEKCQRIMAEFRRIRRDYNAKR